VKRFAIALLAAWLWIAAAVAHEVRPSYLELRETSPGEFSVLWKTPMLGDSRLALDPEFSGDVRRTSAVVTRQPPGAAVQTWTLRAEALRGQTIRILGLESTMTDALARIEFADGTSWTQRLTPRAPAATVPVRESALAVAAVYLKLGVEHILLGIDHLLFVFALLIIARGRWQLVKTVTAFTVAHSITLALATLGFVHVPQRPVEALIALSIAFVATEILRARDGHASLTARAPWIVAFAFGLLHGFGFAGALSEIGLPQGQIPLALLFFNVGVEAGQLLFIAIVLAGLALLHWRMAATAARGARAGALPRWAGLVPPYLIGTTAMFWVFQRAVAL
jgi:hydrogenase/urease accessory protein HupE